MTVIIGMSAEKRCLLNNSLCLCFSGLIESSGKVVQKTEMSPCNEMQKKAVCPLI